MGLLDVFNTDEGRLGLGLLAAAGPRNDGAGFGQRLAEGVGSVDTWKKAALERKMLEQHAKQYEADADHKKAIAAQQASKLAMLQGIFGGAPESPGAFTPSLNGMGPTMPPQMQGQPAGGGIGGMNIDAIAKLKALGGVDLMKEFEYANSPLKLEGGSTYQNRVTGQREFMPKVDPGIAPNANGFYAPLPGYGQAQAGMEGLKTGAVEDAKAGRELVTYTPAGQNNPIQTTKSELLRQITQPQQPSPQRPMLAPGGLLPPAQSSAPSGYAGGSADAAKSEQLRILQAELGNPQYANDRPALQREIDRLSGGAQPSGNRLQSSSEKITSDERAKAAVEQEVANAKKGNEYSDFKNQLKYAESLLKAGPTASWVGNKVDQTYGVFGGSSTSANLAKELETTSGWLVQNIPKAPGAQSNFELEQYKIQAGNVGDANIPVPQRLASLNAAKKQIDIWEDRVKKGEKVAPDYMPSGTKDTPKESLSALPKASDHKGKKIKDTVTGEILVSNGLSWVKAK